jgi:uncharacterized protein
VAGRGSFKRRGYNREPMSGSRPAAPPVWPVALSVALVFCVAQAIGLVFLVLLMLVQGGLPAGGDDLLGRFERVLLSPAGFLGSVVVNGAVFAAASLLGARLGREPWRERLRVAPAAVHPLVLAVLGMLALGTILDALLFLLGWSGEGALGEMADVVAAMPWPMLVAAVLVVGAVAGTTEELFFRGFVQTRLSQRLGARWAVLLTAVLFGAFHFDPWHTPVATAMGLYLGWLTERARSVVPALAAHVVNNAVYVPMVAFGPEELSTAAWLWLMAGSLPVGTLATLAFARAYPPVAARPAPAVEDAPPPLSDSLL